MFRGTEDSAAQTANLVPISKRHFLKTAAAVTAGAVVSLALTLLLLSFGAGLGFAVVSPWGNAGVSATTFEIGSCACMCTFHPDFYLFLSDHYTPIGISNSADLRSRGSGKLTTAAAWGRSGSSRLRNSTSRGFQKSSFELIHRF